MQLLHGGAEMTLRQQSRYRRSLLNRISQRRGSTVASDIASAQRRREIERYLTSHAVQSVVRHEMWSRKHGEEEAKARWQLAQQAPVVPFDYRRCRSQPISFFHKPRSTSGVRKICSLPETLKMWHTVASDLIVAQHQPRPHIGDWRGRGRDRQIDQIRSALVSSRQAVVCADIKHAFASVNFDAVYELPFLPEPLIRRAIDYRSHRFMRREKGELLWDVTRAACNSDYDEMHVALERSPSGLLEGSPASNAIFSVLLDDLPDHLDDGIQAFVYCDNIILLAPTMSCAQRAEEALLRYLSGHRAGPFEIRSSISQVSQRFEHLGYSLRRLPGMPPDVGISRNGWLKLVDRLFIEPRDVEATWRWLKASYGRCYYSSWREFLREVEQAARAR